MPVTQHSTLPSRRGEADATNYKQRVRRQISDHLKKNVGKENIVTGQGKIKVPVKGGKQYRFIHDRGPQGDGNGNGQGDGEGNGRDAGLGPGEEMYEVWLDMAEVEEMLFEELELPRLKPKKEMDAQNVDIKWDSYALQGPNIDKKATLRRNLRRNAAQGEVKIGNFDKTDLRYSSYHEKPKPKSKAVVFLMMDVSGSMMEFHKRIARLFFFWTVRFLRHRYDTVDVRFIAHTAEAKEVTEDQFFNRVESGGTKVSSAYRLAEDMIHQYYPTQDWNIYVLHASDGDNWQLDNQECFDSIQALCKICALVGYLEIKEPGRGAWAGWSTLLDDLGAKRDELGEEFMLTHVKDDSDIWTAIKHFFAKDNVQEYVTHE